MKLSLAIVFASQLFAAGPTGPTAGFILDSRTSTIRSMTGVPGALRLADPVALPFGISAAEFTSSGDLAVHRRHLGEQGGIRDLDIVIRRRDRRAVCRGRM